MNSTGPSPEAQARPRNPRGKGGRLRQDILDAAAELLTEHGSEAVTLRAIARRIGISAPSIYGHFADRQTVLFTLAQSAFAELTEWLGRAARAEPDPAVALRCVCLAYLDFATDEPKRYRIMFGGVWDATDAIDSPGVGAVELNALGRDALATFTEVFRACVEAGRSSSNDAAADSIALWLGLHGLAHQRAVATQFPWPADISARVIDPLLRLREVP